MCRSGSPTAVSRRPERRGVILRSRLRRASASPRTARRHWSAISASGAARLISLFIRGSLLYMMRFDSPSLCGRLAYAITIARACPPAVAWHVRRASLIARRAWEALAQGAGAAGVSGRERPAAQPRRAGDHALARERSTRGPRAPAAHPPPPHPARG